MRKTLLALAILVPFMANAKGVVSSAPNAVPLVAIDGNPLKINIGNENAFQVYNKVIDPTATAGQIYPTSNTVADMGWFVRLGTTLYAPDFAAHGGTATSSIGTYTAYTPISESAQSGAGTAADPFVVTVVADLGSSGLRATQKVSYVNGENFFTKEFRLNNSGAAAVTGKVFLGSDIYLASSDSGVPFRDAASSSPGGQTCAGQPPYTILHIPRTGQAPNAFSAQGFSTVWGQIGAGQLASIVGTGCIDNGAALQWDVSIPAGGSSTLTASTSFGAIPGVITGGGTPIFRQAPTLSWGALAMLVFGVFGLFAWSRRKV
jgi:hypothetical protein